MMKTIFWIVWSSLGAPKPSHAIFCLTTITTLSCYFFEFCSNPLSQFVFFLAHYKAGRLLGSKDTSSHSPSWTEASSESPRMSPKEQVPAPPPAFLDDLKISKPNSSSGLSENQSYHFLGSAQDSKKEKTQLEPQDLSKKKKVWFSDAPDANKLRRSHTFYLNGNSGILLMIGVRKRGGGGSYLNIYE